MKGLIATMDSGAPPSGWEHPEGDAHATAVEKTKLFMLNNFRSEINLDALALEARLSKYHFARQFKAATGLTCMQYLSLVRLSEAAKLLAGTSLRVSEVCYEVGFGDLTNFERRFKRDTGYTPTAFRKTFGRRARAADESAI
jgi:AraC-like DNA-binding protein